MRHEVEAGNLSFVNDSVSNPEDDSVTVENVQNVNSRLGEPDVPDRLRRERWKGQAKSLVQCSERVLGNVDVAVLCQFAKNVQMTRAVNYFKSCDRRPSGGTFF